MKLNSTRFVLRNTLLLEIEDDSPEQCENGETLSSNSGPHHLLREVGPFGQEAEINNNYKFSLFFVIFLFALSEKLTRHEPKFYTLNVSRYKKCKLVVNGNNKIYLIIPDTRNPVVAIQPIGTKGLSPNFLKNRIKESVRFLKSISRIIISKEIIIMCLAFFYSNFQDFTKNLVKIHLSDNY